MQALSGESGNCFYAVPVAFMNLAEWPLNVRTKSQHQQSCEVGRAGSFVLPGQRIVKNVSFAE